MSVKRKVTVPERSSGMIRFRTCACRAPGRLSHAIATIESVKQRPRGGGGCNDLEGRGCHAMRRGRRWHPDVKSEKVSMTDGGSPALSETRFDVSRFSPSSASCERSAGRFSVIPCGRFPAVFRSDLSLRPRIEADSEALAAPILFTRAAVVRCSFPGCRAGFKAEVGWVVEVSDRECVVCRPKL